VFNLNARFLSSHDVDHPTLKVRKELRKKMAVKGDEPMRRPSKRRLSHFNERKQDK